MSGHVPGHGSVTFEAKDRELRRASEKGSAGAIHDVCRASCQELEHVLDGSAIHALRTAKDADLENLGSPINTIVLLLEGVLETAKSS